MLKLITHRIVILAVLWISGSTIAIASPSKSDEKTTYKIAEQFVSKVEKGDINQAFDQIKPFWPLADSEVDDLKAHTIRERETVQKRYGQPIEIEFIRTEFVGNSMIKHTFIEKFEKHALKWQVSFYKPKKDWIINSVYWDDKISELY